ncbi:DUF6457 domain-containing protein [Cellulomonas fimi]|uniref:DUF6457 domain-containing protein n=1 Tax=Cellulomonas fimi TaxID=1708 RepID=UPI001B882844|nr:DUF6457 domain-containing protein [Cellulomonas fimi]
MDDVLGRAPGGAPANRPANPPVTAAADGAGSARPASRAGTAGRLEEWVAAVVAELEIPRDVVDVALVLDLARDAAHGVDRPAAPLTTFLVGYAAGASRAGHEDAGHGGAGQAGADQRGAGQAGADQAGAVALDDLVERVGALARDWADRPREES